MRIKDANEQMEKREQMVIGGEIIIIIEQSSFLSREYCRDKIEGIKPYTSVVHEEE